MSVFPYEPQRDMLFVEMDTAEDDDAAGIKLVRFGTPPSYTGRVRAIGPDVRDVRTGDRVVVSRLHGIEVSGYVLVPESAVLGTVEA